MKLLLLSLFISSLFASDTDKLYQNGKDIKVEIFKNKSFKVTREDGTILRLPTTYEQFYSDKSNNKLEIDYKIIEKIGGVDIEYSIKNPTSNPQNIPDLTVDGFIFEQTKKDKSLHVLNTFNFQYMHKRAFSELEFLRYHYFDVNGGNHVYPEVYSPVIVAHDSSYSVGSSLNLSYIKDRIEPHMRIYQLHNGLWRYSYNDIDNRRLLPSEQLELTLSLRFSKPENWLYTLYPYKKHFNALYGAQKNITPKDLRPISGFMLSFDSVAYENYLECKDKEKACDSNPENIIKYNLYGYNYYIRPDLYGLNGSNKDQKNQKFLDTYIKKLQKSGFKRTMIWASSGQYWRCPKPKIKKDDGVVACTTNYPTQFMSAPAQKVKDSLDSLTQFQKADISLGLWWGRAGQVPSPLTWNPQDVIPFDMKNPSHTSFYKKELQLAKDINVNEIGLDAFPNMRPESQLPWLQEMKKFAPSMKFYNEGSVCDFLHTQISAFLQPQNRWLSHGKGPIKERALLMDYLNPNAEVIVYYPNKSPTLKQLQQLIDWGYTALIIANPNIFEIPLMDVNRLKYSQPRPNLSITAIRK